MAEREPPSLGTYRPNDAYPGARRPASPPRGPVHPPRRPPPQHHGDSPRWGALRITLAALAGAVVLLAVAIALLLMFAPTGFIKDQLVAQVKAKTGRDLVVGGPTSLSLFPNVSVTMDDVSVSPPPGMTGSPTIRMHRLQADVPLLPLIRRQLQIDRLVLTKPVIDLKIDKSGRRSWDFAAIEAQPLVKYAQAATIRTDAAMTLLGRPRAALGPLEDVALGDIRIVDGVVRYADERNGTSEEWRAVDLNLRGQRLSDPLTATGNITWRGERVDFSALVTTPKAVLADQLARLEINLMTKHAEFGLDGSIIASPAFKLDGKLSVDSPSVRALVRWLGAEPPAVNGLGPLRLTGQLAATPASVALKGATIKLDKASAAGDINVVLGKGRPDIRTNLSIDVLDLNDYMPMEGTSTSSAPRSAPSPAKGAAPAVKSIDDLLKRESGTPIPGRFSPQVKGYTKRAGWSEDPIDLTPLRLFDADARLSVGRLIFQEIKTGRAALDVNLKGGMLQALLREMALYDGRGNGQVRLDARNAAPQVAANFTLDGVAALAFLKDASDFDWVDGKARIQFAIAGHGNSEKAIVSSLSGKSAVSFTDGAIVGYNIPKIVRGLQQGQFSNFDRLTSERTDFSSLTATFQIAGGIAANKDLSLVSPLLRVTGEGDVDLGQRLVDYLARPKLVANLSGQGGQQGLSGIEIPFKVTGPWDNPKLTPVLDAVIKNPGAVVDAAKNLADKFKNKKGVSDALKGLLGGGSENGDAKPSTQELLKQLFR
ncbi:MAG: hypothetical protein RLZ98_1418 [Pseudomonadota bacterium]|jgi:AsmA protein